MPDLCSPCRWLIYVTTCTLSLESCLHPHLYSSCTQGNNKAIRQSTYLWSIKNNNIAFYRVLFNLLKGECHPSYQEY